MTANVRVCAVIDASVTAVWAGIVDIKTHVNWMADAKSIRFTSAMHAGIGTQFECVTKLGRVRLVDRMTIIEWKPGETMAIEHRGAVTGSGRFTLNELTPTQTTFCWDEVLTFPWWLGGPIGERLGPPSLSRVWLGNLERLKQMIERGES